VHPADSEAWKQFGHIHKDFAKDVCKSYSLQCT
jgi:hypothetical protein